MPFTLENRLVVGVASSALFDLTESGAVFDQQGEQAYRAYQEEHLGDPLAPGPAFQFIKRLLKLNDLSASEDDPLIEVIIMSRNDPDTGLRVMESIKHHDLPITRAIFRAGQSPYTFIPTLNIALYLSADEKAVRGALSAGYPAGLVLSGTADDDDTDELRISFDFDGVLTDDSAEKVYQSGGLKAFHADEASQATVPLPDGPILPFLKALSRIQAVEQGRREAESTYHRRLSVSVVTARNAPAHARMVHTLKEWQVTVDDAFFLGGIEKGRIMEVLKPHIFFDDQRTHLEGTAKHVPSVHVPFGALNSPQPANDPSAVA
ncbi:5'-nucleotidase [Mycobacteroides abscessus]|uniref:5'-nucleotidase n=1 Tax=Mycobacteroides abscessus TaxID=36809 RepID=UPI0005E3BA38|nr:5'-nucleotidase [Mycobacteroides abscessus]CPU62645.1 5'-nucleotidase [Mycobacteroides abscessus]CPX67819.1 5'-nucleotidase [Mycobacteroides abscessus]CPZ70083.1 5'-nucleotidase [Mycobacteroides abscessus]